MILLLSSEPLVRSILKELLENAGYVVHATGDLGSAADSFADYPIDLLIIRPYIEDVLGHTAAKYLRSRNPHMCVLFVAGMIDDERIRNRADLEHFEIFPELFKPQQFLAKVKEVHQAVQHRQTGKG